MEKLVIKLFHVVVARDFSFIKADTVTKLYQELIFNEEGLNTVWYIPEQCKIHTYSKNQHTVLFGVIQDH